MFARELREPVIFCTRSSNPFVESYRIIGHGVWYVSIDMYVGAVLYRGVIPRRVSIIYLPFFSFLMKRVHSFDLQPC